METQALLLSRIRDLEEERKRLEDGKPCPLCGAKEHPYARGNVPALNSAETALENARNEFRNTSDELSGLEAQQAGVAADILHTEKEMADNKATIATTIIISINVKLLLYILRTHAFHTIIVRLS